MERFVIVMPVDTSAYLLPCAGVTAPARPRGDESSMHSSPEV